MESNTNYNKKEKTKLCKYILDNSDVRVEDKYSRFLVKYIFPYHPEWKEKEGVGIDHIEVRPDGYGHKCFYLIRKDSTVTDISYLTSITPPSKKEQVRTACRTAIRPIIKDIKNSVKLPYRCPITGDIITSMEDIQIDHYDMEFNDVFELWIKDKDLDWLYEDVMKSNIDESTITSFKDESIIKDFIEFHNTHTHLRIVSKKANLSVLKRKSVTAVTTHEGREVSLW